MKVFVKTAWHDPALYMSDIKFSACKYLGLDGDGLSILHSHVL